MNIFYSYIFRIVSVYYSDKFFCLDVNQWLGISPSH